MRKQWQKVNNVTSSCSKKSLVDFVFSRARRYFTSEATNISAIAWCAQCTNYLFSSLKWNFVFPKITRKNRESGKSSSAVEWRRRAWEEVKTMETICVQTPVLMEAILMRFHCTFHFSPIRHSLITLTELFDIVHSRSLCLSLWIETKWLRQGQREIKKAQRRTQPELSHSVCIVWRFVRNASIQRRRFSGDDRNIKKKKKLKTETNNVIISDGRTNMFIFTLLSLAFLLCALCIFFCQPSNSQWMCRLFFVYFHFVRSASPKRIEYAISASRHALKTECIKSHHSIVVLSFSASTFVVVKQSSSCVVTHSSVKTRISDRQKIGVLWSHFISRCTQKLFDWCMLEC